MTITEKVQLIFRQNSRSFFALALIALSLVSASLIVKEAGKSDSMWAARTNISPGELFSSANLVEVPVLLKSTSPHYFHTSESIFGLTAVRTISSGDLIPRQATSRIANVLDYRSVPLQVTKNDLPNDLMTGERVDIYALPTRTGIAGSEEQVVEVAHAIPVESIDLKARDLGGAIGVVVRMSSENILNFFGDTANSRIVLVRNAR